MVMVHHRRDRGQTTQDFAIGIALFLLAIVFVIGFLPSILVPVDGGDTTERSAQAERLAADIVANASVSDDRVILDHARLEAELDAFADGSGVAVPPGRSVNVTLETADGERVVINGGDTYDGSPAGVWTRIVTTDESCDPSCRLIVRVW